jgi:5-formyltetrahydrofolate cyclo-ligase
MRLLHEAGHPVALPWFAARRADAVPPVAVPPLEEDLEADPWGVQTGSRRAGA